MGRLQQKQMESLKDLMEQGHHHDEEGNYAASIKCFKSALGISPSCTDAMDCCAFSLIESGTVEEAVKLLQQSIEVAPDKNFQKYFTLAQIREPCEEALNLFQKGIEIATRDKETAQDENERLKLEEQIVSAMCAKAEIYLAMAERAFRVEETERFDTEAENTVLQALAVSRTGYAMMESCQALANLRLSQGRGDEAFSAMERVLKYVRPLFIGTGHSRVQDSAQSEQPIKDVEMLDSGTEERRFDKLATLPPIPMLIAIAKQLLEVKHWQGTKEVLLNIIQACDYNIEVWYLLAIAHTEADELDDALDALSEISRARESPDSFDGEVDNKAISSLQKTIEARRKNSRPRTANDKHDSSEVATTSNPTSSEAP